MLQQQLARVRERISQAARRCGRDPAAISLIGVTKHVPAGRVADALALGLKDVGENRVQEAAAKRKELQQLGVPFTVNRVPTDTVDGPIVTWHLIGHLQRNKAKDAAGLFDAIHSVDSRALIDALERHAAAARRAIDVFVQVNVSGEATKFGCDPAEAASLVSAIQASPLRLVGLMTIAPFAEDPEAARPSFRRLRQLRDSLDHNLKLSMGMSSDFEIAIEEGADWVRIGTAIFGARS